MALQVLSYVNLWFGLATTTRYGVEALVGTIATDAGGTRFVAVTSGLSRSAKGTCVLDGGGDRSFFASVDGLGIVCSHRPRNFCLLLVGWEAVAEAAAVGISRMLIMR